MSTADYLTLGPVSPYKDAACRRLSCREAAQHRARLACEALAVLSLLKYLPRYPAITHAPDAISFQSCEIPTKISRRDLTNLS